MSPGKHSSLFRRSIGDDGEEKSLENSRQKDHFFGPTCQRHPTNFSFKKEERKRERWKERERGGFPPLFFLHFKLTYPATGCNMSRSNCERPFLQDLSLLSSFHERSHKTFFAAGLARWRN